MEPTTIFLSACVIVLIYMVYYTYTFNATLLLSSVSPANSPITITPPVPVSGSLSSSFTFSIWINVNDWNVNSGFYKNIISYGNSVYISLAQLTNDVVVSFVNKTTNTIIQNTVINNVPLQMWVHLAFSLNGQTLDTYLNGKLVKTTLISTGSYGIPTSQDTITLGGSNAIPADCGVVKTTTGCGSAYLVKTTANPGFSGWVTQFQYAPTGSDPQTIWNIFQQGNGTNIFSNFFGNYGLSVALTNNGVAQNTISI
jgi:hypothetical protein